MQVNDTKWLRLKPGDYVCATFSDVDDDVTAVEGIVSKCTDDLIEIREGVRGHGKRFKFGMWQMLSLVCSEKDISFIREGNPVTDLVRLTLLLR